mmetsp:Transcript_41101/g.95981  ORF Transcript_41101/g.95981 Transcript_41101/m.95981 type:complete len:213 (-) Transcript_41101:9-647(-)
MGRNICHSRLSCARSLAWLDIQLLLMPGMVSVSYIAWTYRAPVSCSVASHTQATTAYGCSWTPRPYSESISSLPTIFRMTCPSSRRESTWHPRLHSDGVSATSVGRQPRICAHWRIFVMSFSPPAFGLPQAGGTRFERTCDFVGTRLSPMQDIPAEMCASCLATRRHSCRRRTTESACVESQRGSEFRDRSQQPCSDQVGLQHVCLSMKRSR